jgi:hypothetical protein
MSVRRLRHTIESYVREDGDLAHLEILSLGFCP